MKKTIVVLILLLTTILGGCMAPYIQGGYSYGVGYGAPYGGTYVRPDYGHRHPGVYQQRRGMSGTVIRTLPCGGYVRC